LKARNLTLGQAFEAARKSSSRRASIGVETTASDAVQNDAFIATRSGTYRRPMRAANPAAGQKRFGPELQGAWRTDCHFETPPTGAAFRSSPPRPQNRLEPAVKSIAVAKCWKSLGTHASTIRNP
jgi:hypothetical protein